MLYQIYLPGAEKSLTPANILTNAPNAKAALKKFLDEDWRYVPNQFHSSTLFGVKRESDEQGRIYLFRVYVPVPDFEIKEAIPL